MSPGGSNGHDNTGRLFVVPEVASFCVRMGVEHHTSRRSRSLTVEVRAPLRDEQAHSSLAPTAGPADGIARAARDLEMSRAGLCRRSQELSAPPAWVSTAESWAKRWLHYSGARALGLCHRSRGALMPAGSKWPFLLSGIDSMVPSVLGHRSVPGGVQGRESRNRLDYGDMPWLSRCWRSPWGVGR